jgi:light-harvesting complex 1 beta chain
LKPTALQTGNRRGSQCRVTSPPNTSAAIFVTLNGAAKMADTSLSGLTPEQAKEFHEQFKTTFSAFVAVAGVVHVLVFAAKPWF